MKKKLIILMAIASIFYACGGKDCSEKKGEYQEGYNNGKITMYSNENISCEEWVENLGKNESYATDCFCSGFSDAQLGHESRYPEKEE